MWGRKPDQKSQGAFQKDAKIGWAKQYVERERGHYVPSVFLKKGNLMSSNV